MRESYDFIIVGSGFGGSVSAMRLAQKGYRVLVLERGKRYRAEDFPQTNWNIGKFLWMPALRCFGIMGINFLNDMMILNGSGVGGGSLVYASTHIRPGKAFFEAPEWQGLADWEAELTPHYDTAEFMLGVNENPKFWAADHALHKIATELGQEHTFKPTPVAIYFGEPGKTVPDPFFGGDGPERTGCIHCGGCMVGCKHNAKNTLDKNYLYFAEKWGAEVLPEANVVDIKMLHGKHYDNSPRYEVVFEKTTDWVVRRKTAVTAHNVILAAGVLGTVDLLLRCRDETQSLPDLSPRLGRMVRSNSEALMGVTARESKEDFSQGVAITSHFWADDVTSVEPVRYSSGSSLMRNLAVPLVDMGESPGKRFLRFLEVAVKRPYDLLKVRFLPRWAEDSTILLIMQTVDNRMQLKRGRSIFTLFRKGLVSEPNEKAPIPVIEAGRKVTERFAELIDGIPQSTIHEVLLDKPSTAHILGGAVIGKDAAQGVIDSQHEVFNYPGLYVVDGSSIPANLGVNPSLTITAMAERAMSFIPEAPERRNEVPAGVTIQPRPSRFPYWLLTAVPLALIVVKLLKRTWHKE
ncbi:MAG: GMC family oxidoreductase [Ardenticatenaceae bacterium]|nr:GMC family oxidoreductase [Ardenticatenaceae bacterium]